MCDYVAWKHNSILAAEELINKTDHCVGCFGIETVKCADSEASYINTGDTYNMTVLLNEEGELQATTWGDWYERTEQKHCEEKNVIRCGYCGKFTPFDYDGDLDWHECVCESCGNLVAGG